MTPIPERALELYAAIAKSALLGLNIADRNSKLEVAAILRHYAEIQPKWQAVLDAEPRRMHSCDIPGCLSCGNPPDRDDFEEELQMLMDRDMGD